MLHKLWSSHAPIVYSARTNLFTDTDCKCQRRQQELLSLLLKESTEVRAVPRVTRAAMISCLAAAATSAQPVQDAAWNAVALRHLQSIAASVHFYSSPALTQRISTGTA